MGNGNTGNGEGDGEDEEDGFAALQALAATKLLAILADLGHMTVEQLADTNNDDNNGAGKATDNNGALVKGKKAKKGSVESDSGPGQELANGQGQGKELCVTLLDVAVATVRYLLTEGGLRLHRNDNNDDDDNSEDGEDDDDDEDDDEGTRKAGRKITKTSSSSASSSSSSSSSSSAVMVVTEEHSAVLAAIEAMGAVMPHFTPCLSYHHHQHTVTKITSSRSNADGKNKDGNDDVEGGSGVGSGRGYRVREALYMLLGQAVFHVLASEGKDFYTSCTLCNEPSSPPPTLKHPLTQPVPPF